jgi:uncharacterized protein (TIGR03437 family)
MNANYLWQSIRAPGGGQTVEVQHELEGYRCQKRSFTSWKLSAETAFVLLTVGFVSPAAAQSLSATTMTVDITNHVYYQNDVSDYSKFATSPSVTPGQASRDWSTFTHIGDIVAVNGKPAKGTWTSRAINVGFTDKTVPGATMQAIADIVRGNIADMYWEILQADGTPVGTIMAAGLTRGTPPPGAPTAMTGDNMTIIGGTGAFLGMRGEVGNIQIVSPRGASVVEDPAYRRTNGGGVRSYVFHLIPMTAPEVVMTANGPAIVHAGDFSIVSATRPVTAGETLTLFARGLGPTRPAVDPGKAYPANPLAVANSPIGVTLNGQAADVLYAGGYPGSVDAYQVNCRVPDGLSPGLATLQVSMAWIGGSAVTLAVKMKPLLSQPDGLARL